MYIYIYIYMYIYIYIYIYTCIHVYSVWQQNKEDASCIAIIGIETHTQNNLIYYCDTAAAEVCSQGNSRGLTRVETTR